MVFHFMFTFLFQLNLVHPPSEATLPRENPIHPIVHKGYGQVRHQVAR